MPFYIWQTKNGVGTVGTRDLGMDITCKVFNDEVEPVSGKDVCSYTGTLCIFIIFVMHYSAI